MNDDAWLRPATCLTALASCLVVGGCTPSVADRARSSQRPLFTSWKR